MENNLLKKLNNFYGWKGGTIHQAIRELKKRIYSLKENILFIEVPNQSSVSFRELDSIFLNDTEKEFLLIFLKDNQ